MGHTDGASSNDMSGKPSHVDPDRAMSSELGGELSDDEEPLEAIEAKGSVKSAVDRAEVGLSSNLGCLKAGAGNSGAAVFPAGFGTALDLVFL